MINHQQIGGYTEIGNFQDCNLKCYNVQVIGDKDSGKVVMKLGIKGQLFSKSRQYDRDNNNRTQFCCALKRKELINGQYQQVGHNIWLYQIQSSKLINQSILSSTFQFVLVYKENNKESLNHIENAINKIVSLKNKVMHKVSFLIIQNYDKNIDQTSLTRLKNQIKSKFKDSKVNFLRFNTLLTKSQSLQLQQGQKEMHRIYDQIIGQLMKQKGQSWDQFIKGKQNILKSSFCLSRGVDSDYSRIIENIQKFQEIYTEDNNTKQLVTQLKGQAQNKIQTEQTQEDIKKSEIKFNQSNQNYQSQIEQEKSGCCTNVIQSIKNAFKKKEKKQKS